MYVKWCDNIIWLTVCMVAYLFHIIHFHSQRFCRIPRGPTLTFKIQQVLKILYIHNCLVCNKSKSCVGSIKNRNFTTLDVRPEECFLLWARDYIMFVCAGGNIIILRIDIGRVKILVIILQRKGVYVYRPLATFITVTRLAINSLFFS